LVRLADFIDTRSQEILVYWEAFAATRLPASSKMDALALRDHAPQILQAISADLRTPQTATEQQAKSHGLMPVSVGARNTAAEVHGMLRAQSGFSLIQLASEYRALRASVLRLWAAVNGSEELASAAEDVMRFNEAVDQAIAESVAFYSQEVDRSRQLFLGILGHDLRNPLNAIQMTAKLLIKIRSDEMTSKAVQRLITSGARMESLLDDLLDYNRTTLCGGLQIRPESADLGEICSKVLDEAEAVAPDRKVLLETSGDLRGFWDAKRLHQALGNLVTNALIHGAASQPVRVRVEGEAQLAMISVTNQGPPIPPAKMLAIFDPLRRVSAELEPASSHLGLGLFITREIVKAHGGEIKVASNEVETVFTVRLPRQSGVSE
jgi:signal transduction histidine kinase